MKVVLFIFFTAYGNGTSMETIEGFKDLKSCATVAGNISSKLSSVKRPNKLHMARCFKIGE